MIMVSGESTIPLAELGGGQEEPAARSQATVDKMTMMLRGNTNTNASSNLDRNSRLNASKNNTLDNGSRSNHKMRREENNLGSVSSRGPLYHDDSPTTQSGQKKSNRRTSFNDNGALEKLFAKISRPQVAIEGDTTERDSDSANLVVMDNMGGTKENIITKKSIEETVRGFGSGRSNDLSTSGRQSSMDGSNRRSSMDTSDRSNHSTGRSRRAGRKNSMLTSSNSGEGSTLSPIPAAPASTRAMPPVRSPPTKTPPFSEAKLRGVSPAAMRRKMRHQSLDTSGHKQLTAAAAVDITDSSMDLFAGLSNIHVGDEMNRSAHFPSIPAAGQLRLATSGGGTSQRRRFKRSSIEHGGEGLGHHSYHGPPPTLSDDFFGPSSGSRRANSSERRRRRSNDDDCGNRQNQEGSSSSNNSGFNDAKEESNPVSSSRRSNSADGRRRRRVESRERRSVTGQQREYRRQSSAREVRAEGSSSSLSPRPGRSEDRSGSGLMRRCRSRSIGADQARILYQQDSAGAECDESHSNNDKEEAKELPPPPPEDGFSSMLGASPRQGRSRRHSLEMAARTDTSSARQRSVSRSSRRRRNPNKSTASTATEGSNSGNSSNSYSPTEEGQDLQQQHHSLSTPDGERSRSPRRPSSGGGGTTNSPKAWSHSSSNGRTSSSRSPKAHRSNSQDGSRSRRILDETRSGSRRKLKGKSPSSNNFHTTSNCGWEEGGAADWIVFDS